MAISGEESSAATFRIGASSFKIPMSPLRGVEIAARQVHHTRAEAGATDDHSEPEIEMSGTTTTFDIEGYRVW